jgi:hypothetical protein
MADDTNNPVIETRIPENELAAVIRDYHRNDPAPLSVTTAPDGQGTFTVTVWFAPDSQIARAVPNATQPAGQKLQSNTRPAAVGAIPANGSGDKQCIPRLIQLGSDMTTLHQTQAIAANSMEAAGYPHNLHNACAATLSAFLNEAGIPIKTTLNAGNLADRLGKERNWIKVAVGRQQAGDVGVAQKNVHIYLVVDTRGVDEMTVADNQKPVPHARFASGKGATLTAYFLRAPDEQTQVAALASSFFPTGDQDTSMLRDA